MTTKTPFQTFIEVISALRDPETGCPWDIKQTHESIRPYLLEETYEVLEAIDSKDSDELKKELGDLLLQVALHSQIAKDSGTFEIDDVIRAITEKMIHRHPHVFGDASAADDVAVKEQWERIKQGERSTDNQDSSTLAGVPKALPSLVRSQRMGDKAAHVGFDWPDVDSVFEKLDEELGELKEAIAEGAPSKIEHELGDVLFCLTQLARKLSVSSEDSLRGCANRFDTRFRALEKKMRRSLQNYSLEELEAAWQEVKKELA